MRRCAGHDPGMAERFEARYTDAQRDALASAYEDRRIRPARRVVELAQAGELAEGLAAFDVAGGENTVRDFARKLRRTRAAEHTSELSKQPPRDAIETLRRRIVDVCDGMLSDIERQPAGKRDPERVRQAARAIREAAAIPGATDPPPSAKPGHSRAPDGRRTEGETRGGPVGALLAASRGQGSGAAINGPEPATVPDGTLHTAGHAINDGTTNGSQHTNQPTREADTDAPGDWARAEIARRFGEEITPAIT